VRSLFIHCQSLPIVSQSAALNDRISSTLDCLHLFIRMWPLILGVHIWRCPSIFMNISISEYCILTLRFLDVAKFTTLTPLELLISCKFSFQIGGLKMFSLPTLAVKSRNLNVRMLLREFFQRYFPIPHRSYLSHLQFNSLLRHEQSVQ
jgi:hypothetical protein